MISKRVSVFIVVLAWGAVVGFGLLGLTQAVAQNVAIVGVFGSLFVATGTGWRARVRR